MSLIPGNIGSPTVHPEGVQTDHMMEITSNHGVSVPGRKSGVAMETGYVGEYAEINSTGAVSITTGQWTDGGCSGYTPGAGIWDVQVHSYINLSATTVLQAQLVGLGTAAGNNGAGVNYNRGATKILNPAGGTMTDWFNVSSPTIRIVANGSTTYYAKSITYFATSTATAANYMTWRRIA